MKMFNSAVLPRVPISPSGVAMNPFYGSKDAEAKSRWGRCQKLLAAAPQDVLDWDRACMDLRLIAFHTNKYITLSKDQTLNFQVSGTYVESKML